MRLKHGVTVLALAVVLFAPALTPAPARASTVPKRLLAWQYALWQHYKTYCWGGTGPYCFDCSGLVYKAYRHAGFSIPRTTYEILHWWRLRRIPKWQARRGDLVFWGNYHVELLDRGWWSYGARNFGTRIGYHYNYWWRPSGYYRVYGANL